MLLIMAGFSFAETDDISKPLQASQAEPIPNKALHRVTSLDVNHAGTQYSTSKADGLEP